MKILTLRSLPLALLFLTATLFTSCNLFDKADDVTFNRTLDQNIAVSETSSGKDVPYEQEIVLDATTDSEIERYKDKIKGFEVKKINYTISSYTGDFSTIFNGILAFGDEAGSTSNVSATITNLDLKAAYTAGTVFELTIPASDVAKVESMLKDKKAVKVYLTGTLSQTPVSFVMSVTLDVAIQANTL